VYSSIFIIPLSAGGPREGAVAMRGCIGGLGIKVFVRIECFIEFLVAS
jgi:hypothetical protein